MTTYLEVEIEAESVDDAWLKARNVDGGDFTEVDGTGDWDIYDVEET